MPRIDFRVKVAEMEARGCDPAGREMTGNRNQFNNRDALDSYIFWAGSAEPRTGHSCLLFDALRTIRDLRGWSDHT